jgi:hypothetical protein
MGVQEKMIMSVSLTASSESYRFEWHPKCRTAKYIFAEMVCIICKQSVKDDNVM